ncbi:hypothetical protein GF345_02110 [Candidatus Woesearchaeota archaeon]|nr:hypothetical protein [Candidatus Woesearchaeota archaeon]
MPNEVYKTMDNFFKEIFYGLARDKSIKDSFWKLWKKLTRNNKKENKSILITCYEKKITIIYDATIALPLICGAVKDN